MFFKIFLIFVMIRFLQSNYCFLEELSAGHRLCYGFFKKKNSMLFMNFVFPVAKKTDAWAVRHKTVGKSNVKHLSPLVRVGKKTPESFHLLVSIGLMNNISHMPYYSKDSDLKM